MSSLLPTISMTDLQRRAKGALAEVQDYAVVQSHGKDIALVLNPELGKALLESAMFQQLLKEFTKQRKDVPIQDIDSVIGQVLRELSKR